MFLQNHTLEELRVRVLKLLERYSSNGVINTCGEISDINGRLVESANTHLRMLYSEILRPVRRVQINIKKLNFLCSKQYTIKSGKPLIWESLGTGMVFYCKVRGDMTFTVESESGSVSYEIYSKNGEPTVLCGSAKNCKDSHMKFRAQTSTEAEFLEFYAFWGATYGEGEEIEVTSEGIMFPKIPGDCAEIISIYDKNGRKVTQGTVEYSLYSGRLYADVKNYGIYTLEYVVAPHEISSDATDEENIRLPDILFDALCYMCASDICPASDGNVFSKLTYKYREILENYYSRSRNLVSSRNSFFTLTGRIKK